MKNNLIITVVIAVIVVALVFISLFVKKSKLIVSPKTTIKIDHDPLTIKAMRQRSYPGSDLKIEETLDPGINYNRYLVSYLSEGLKIYALLTVPTGQRPKNGWPVIIFNHGYIPPEVYKTTERYVAYVDAFARSGYLVLKPDYRGNGNSEGRPEGAYYSPAYTVDVLNALTSIRKYKDADSNKIGMWGHSMGGNITLRSLVISDDIKSAVIWAGVVGSYNDLLNNWHRIAPFQPSQRELTLRNSRRQELYSKYGTLEQNPDFWQSIDPTYFLKDINTPIQLHHGLADEEVPVLFSQNLFDKLIKLEKTSEFYTYEGADHNLSGSAFNLAMDRSVRFFDKYLK